jgi:hypothetical protein
MIQILQQMKGWGNIVYALLAAIAVKVCWYSDGMLGRRMQRYTGYSREDAVEMRLAIYIVLVFFEAIWATLLYAVIQVSGVHSLWKGVLLGLMFFSCLAAPLGVLYSFQLRKPGILLIHAGYLFIVSVVMSGVLAVLEQNG